MHHNKCEISIVVPMYNESSNVTVFFQRLVPILESTALSYEIICINDGSSDDTLLRLNEERQNNPAIAIIDLSRNFGKELALTAGLNYSRGNAVIPIDSDLQDPPELITSMIAKWREGYDVVYAVRSSRSGESFMKRLTAKMFYKTINYITDIDIPRDTGDFRLLDRRVVDVLNRIPENTRFMKGLFAWVGFKQTGIFFDRDPRFSGKTKWSYWKLWNLAIDGITLFSATPLKVWTYAGFSIALFSLMFAVYIIIKTLVKGIDVPGYASIMVTVLFIGGIQLLSVGIMGEYIGRIYTEAKRRPLYIVNKVYGIDKDSTS
ncbi:glycosyltransferase family 2 protein [Candidatus Magnetomonas plexicatena]|nr:glycosyltransferase family 2 protein [Nitrospirales bacterium LBB_01]